MYTLITGIKAFTTATKSASVEPTLAPASTALETIAITAETAINLDKTNLDTMKV